MTSLKPYVKAWAVEVSDVLIGPFYGLEDAAEYITTQTEKEGGTIRAAFEAHIRPIMASEFDYVAVQDVRVIGNVKADVKIEGIAPDVNVDDVDDEECDCDFCNPEPEEEVVECEAVETEPEVESEDSEDEPNAPAEVAIPKSKEERGCSLCAFERAYPEVAAKIHAYESLFGRPVGRPRSLGPVWNSGVIQKYLQEEHKLFFSQSAIKTHLLYHGKEAA
jgi:hypothetical protein